MPPSSNYIIMALNPPTNAAGSPYRVQGEHYILSRHEVEFEVKIDGIGTFYGKGDCVLTSNRLVLLNTRGGNQDKFKAFDVPLAYTYGESFEQPIFGANYVKG